MRKLFFNFIFLMSLGSVFGQAEHVILISVDGLRPEFYKDPSWPAPVMQSMAENGAYADYVRGVFPSVTYPSHTTILTGTLPIRHGIYYNAPFEPGGQTGRWYWEEELIRVSTLWDAAGAKELVTANLFWPVSLGAPLDYNVPEIWPLDRDEDPYEYAKTKVTPPALVDELENAVGALNESSFRSQLPEPGCPDRIYGQLYN